MTKVSQTWSFGRRVGRDAPQDGAGCAVGLHGRRHLFISGEDVCRLDVVGVRTAVGKAQPFAARHARGSE